MESFPTSGRCKVEYGWRVCLISFLSGSMIKSGDGGLSRCLVWNWEKSGDRARRLKLVLREPHMQV